MDETERLARRVIARVVDRMVYRINDEAVRELSPHRLGPAAQQRLAALVDHVADAMLGRTPESREMAARLRDEALDIFCPAIKGGRTITHNGSEAVARWVEDRLPRVPPDSRLRTSAQQQHAEEDQAGGHSPQE